jgi:hypothetical protein
LIDLVSNLKLLNACKQPVVLDVTRPVNWFASVAKHANLSATRSAFFDLLEGMNALDAMMLVLLNRVLPDA